MKSFCLVLSLFARRVITSIANSVLLERAFLNMNYIHNKLRNLLDIKCANKLQFMHMNSGHTLKSKIVEEPDNGLLE
jgi:hypothetical protein